MPKITRRTFVNSTLATCLATPAITQENWNPDLNNPDLGFGIQQDQQTRLSDESKVQRNISSFKARGNWQNYFSNIKNGAILVDIKSRVLYFWSSDESVYKVYPIAVPTSDELTRLGRTKVIKKRVGPSWIPTPNMLKRNPSWPKYIAPGPGNPLGSHALYLSWTYYRIHGTHDNRKIGRKSSNGCIGLYNAHIAELYDLTEIGAQVLFL